jgi:hypothetical protein
LKRVNRSYILELFDNISTSAAWKVHVPLEN